MEAVRSTWTDERLDDFRGQVDSRLAGLADRVSEQSSRIDSLQQTILIVGGGISASFVAVLAALIGLIATQI